jgi:dipeptidyl aminopeptidase/acylaminoacyl peptidase
VPYSQAIKLADAMAKAGVPGRLELLIGAGHAWIDDLLLVKHTLDETYAFFDEHLKPNR